MLTAMAHELVEKRGIGESADSVWRLFREQRSPLCRDGGYAERTTGAIAIGAAAPKW